jgi:hypothetical protein
MLARRLSRDGVGTCTSGHSAGPPGVSIHFVHWWSGSSVMEVTGGMAGCGIMHIFFKKYIIYGNIFYMLYIFKDRHIWPTIGKSALRAGVENRIFV